MKHPKCRQALVWLLITVHLTMIPGCATANRVTLSSIELPVGSNLKIASVILKDGQIIEFDGDGGLCIEKTRDGKTYRAIVGTTRYKNIEIDTENVLEARVEQKQSGGVGSFLAGFLIGLPVGAGILVLIFLLSFNGH